MSPMQSAAMNFVQTLSDPASTPEQANERAQEMMTHLKATDPVELDGVVKTIAQALTFDNPVRGGLAAVCAGALVEGGASPAVLGIPLIERIPDILIAAARYYGELVELVGMQGEAPAGDISYGVTVDGNPVPNAIVDAARQELPKQAKAFQALDTWCLPTIACLSLSVDLRRRAQDAGLLPYTAALEGSPTAATWLHLMLRVLDNEPLLVLHPDSRQGFECKMSGISTNFQLHTLLADTLLKDEAAPPPSPKPGLFGKLMGKPEPVVSKPRGWLRGTRPSAQVAAVVRGRGPQKIDETSTGVWNLYHWFALDEDGELPRNIARRESWIWNEGCPADIEAFDGTRIILLGPPAIARAWGTTRDFDKLKASLDVLKVLTPAEVDDWVARLAKSAAKRSSSA